MAGTKDALAQEAYYEGKGWRWCMVCIDYSEDDVVDGVCAKHRKEREIEVERDAIRHEEMLDQLAEDEHVAKQQELFNEYRAEEAR